MDDRLAAMVFLDEVLIPAHLVTPDLLPRLSSLFPPGLISDFKACDHFAAKVLQPLLIRYGVQVSNQLRYWFRADSVWQARSALSALTPLASDAIYDDLLYDGCSIVLGRPEEEAKSIVGSALRAWGKVRPELVENFLEDHHNLMNTNAACLNKATSFLESGRAQYFREQRRMLLAWNAQLGGSSHQPHPHTPHPQPGQSSTCPIEPPASSPSALEELIGGTMPIAQIASESSGGSRSGGTGNIETGSGSGHAPALTPSSYFLRSGSGFGERIERGAVEGDLRHGGYASSQGVSTRAVQRDVSGPHILPFSGIDVGTVGASVGSTVGSTVIATAGISAGTGSMAGGIDAGQSGGAGHDEVARTMGVSYGRITRRDSGARRRLRRQRPRSVSAGATGEGDIEEREEGQDDGSLDNSVGDGE